MPFSPGDMIPDFIVADIDGQPVAPADYRGHKLMVSFFRFAACPFCNLRVHELSAKQSTFQDRLKVIAIFQSPAEALFRSGFKQRLGPFTLVADPEMRLFRQFQGESSWQKMIAGHMLHIPAWFEGVRKGAFASGMNMGELRLVPADFLVDEQGIIRRAHYGRDVADHLPLREISAFIQAQP
jgi:peroxiredoxin